MKKLFWGLKLPAFLIGSMLGTTIAQEAKPGPTPLPTAHKVVVPFNHDPENPQLPIPEDARRYYLDYATFDRLWKLAKENRIRENTASDLAASGEKDFIVTNALYRGEARRDRIEIEGRLTVQTRGKPWQKVPLPFAQVNISKIELDGVPASYQGGAVLIEEPGLHQVTVTYEVPIADGAKSAKWKIPPASATLLALSLDSELAEPVINNGLPLVKSSDGGTVFTAALGQATEIDFRRRLKTSGRGMTQPNVAVIDSHLFVTPALERLETRFRLEFSGQEENSFSIAFDPSITPVKFEIPNLATWRMAEAGAESANAGLRVLEFELTQPVRDAITISMVGERLVDNLDGRREFPAFGANAMRIEQLRSLLRTDELNVQTEPGGRHRQSDFQAQGVDINGFVPVSTFVLTGSEEALAYVLSEETPQRSASVEYVYQVSPGKLETIGQFQIRSPETPLLNLSLALPSGATIQAVEGNRVKDWWRTGDELFVRFAGETPDITALLVYLAEELDADVSAVPVAPFSLVGFEDDQVSGVGLVVAHVTEDTLLRFDQSRQVVREVDPGDAATDFEVLAPLERKRGFRFEKAAFSGTATLSPIEPRFDTSWVMLAQAYESWLRLSVQTDVEVTQSAVDRIVFSTDETVPELRVISPEVREVRTAVVEGRREYTVIFQRYVTDAIAFTLETEISHAGSAALPDIEFFEATRQERYVIVENQGNDRIDLESGGLESTVSDLLPFKPETLQSAQLFRARAGWNATVSVEKLETTAGNEAVILYAELSTAFRANGEEWVKAVYHLQNRSLQFLPVALPEEVELVGVTVAGQEVRADRGEVDGRQVVLVPLIQTKPGQLAYDVNLVYRSREGVGRSGKRLKSLDRKLDDPEVVGLTVEKTLWNVYLPAEHQLKEADGNMDRVARQANLVEKLEADLVELDYLNGLGASSKVDYWTLNLACDNGMLVADRIEKGLSQIGGQEATEIQMKLQQQRQLVAGNSDKLRSLQQQQTGMQQGQQVNIGGGFQGADQGEVNWFENRVELVTRNKGIEKKNLDQLQRIETQVRLNDNVSIGNTYFNSGMVTQAPVGDPFGTSPQQDQVKGKAAATKRAQIGKLSQGKESMAVEEKLKDLNYAQIGHGGFDGKGQAPAKGQASANYIEFYQKAASTLR